MGVGGGLIAYLYASKENFPKIKVYRFRNIQNNFAQKVCIFFFFKGENIKYMKYKLYGTYEKRVYMVTQK